MLIIHVSSTHLMNCILDISRYAPKCCNLRTGTKLKPYTRNTSNARNILALNTCNITAGHLSKVIKNTMVVIRHDIKNEI